MSAGQAHQLEVAAADDCPCCPADGTGESGACDTCVDCTCHTSDVGPTFRLAYAPLIDDLSGYETFKHLPEVYLPKFIPPQNLS